jgi:hypothetical protein
VPKTPESSSASDLPDIVYHYAEGSFFWNAGALQRYGSHTIRLTGERADGLVATIYSRGPETSNWSKAQRRPNGPSRGYC